MPCLLFICILGCCAGSLRTAAAAALLLAWCATFEAPLQVAHPLVKMARALRHAGVAAGVAVLAVLSRAPCLPGGFVYDDAAVLEASGVVRRLEPWHAAFQQDYWGAPITSPQSHGSYRPLAVLALRVSTWAAGVPLGELAPPWHYRAVGFALHAVNAVLVYALVLALGSLVAASRGPRASSSSTGLPVARTALAAAAAAVFAAHPVATEAVCNIANRAEVSAGSFSLITLLVFTRWLGRQMTRLASPAGSTPPPFASCGATRLLLACTALTAVSTLFKETGIVAPLVCASLCGVWWLVLGSSAWQCQLTSPSTEDSKAAPAPAQVPAALLRRARRALLVCGVGFIACAAAITATRVVVQGRRIPRFGPTDNPAAELPDAGSWGMTIAYLWARHVALLFHPSPLAADWSYLSLPPVMHARDPRNWASAAVLAVQAAAATWVIAPACCCSSRGAAWSPLRLIVAAACAAAFVPLLPASNLLFPVGFAVAERVLYTSTAAAATLIALAEAGIAAVLAAPLIMRVVAAACSRCRRSNGDAESPRAPSRVLASACLALVLAPLVADWTTRSRTRAEDWVSTLRLWGADIAVNPTNPKAHWSLGKALAQAGDLEAAQASYARAIALLPSRAVFPHLSPANEVMPDLYIDAANLALLRGDAQQHLGWLQALMGRVGYEEAPSSNVTAVVDAAVVTTTPASACPAVVHAHHYHHTPPVVNAQAAHRHSPAFLACAATGTAMQLGEAYRHHHEQVRMYAAVPLLAAQALGGNASTGGEAVDAAGGIVSVLRAAAAVSKFHRHKIDHGFAYETAAIAVFYKLFGLADRLYTTALRWAALEAAPLVTGARLPSVPAPDLAPSSVASTLATAAAVEAFQRSAEDAAGLPVGGLSGWVAAGAARQETSLLVAADGSAAAASAGAPAATAGGSNGGGVCYELGWLRRRLRAGDRSLPASAAESSTSVYDVGLALGATLNATDVPYSCAQPLLRNVTCGRLLSTQLRAAEHAVTGLRDLTGVVTAASGLMGGPAGAAAAGISGFPLSGTGCSAISEDATAENAAWEALGGANPPVGFLLARFIPERVCGTAGAGVAAGEAAPPPLPLLLDAAALNAFPVFENHAVAQALGGVPWHTTCAPWMSGSASSSGVDTGLGSGCFRDAVGRAPPAPLHPTRLTLAQVVDRLVGATLATQAFGLMHSSSSEGGGDGVASSLLHGGGSGGDPNNTYAEALAMAWHELATKACSP